MNSQRHSLFFMSSCVKNGEQSARSKTQSKYQIIRLGAGLWTWGRICRKMLFPIVNLCGRIGSGRKPVVWVHIQDVLRAIEFLMLHETTAQVFNVVSPKKVTQSAFAQTAAQILKRKPVLSLPAFVQVTFRRAVQLVLKWSICLRLKH